MRAHATSTSSRSSATRTWLHVRADCGPARVRCPRGARGERCRGPRSRGDAVFYWLLRWVFIGPLLKTVFRPRTEGAENVPEVGPAILASNHLSYADWLFMPLMIPRRVTFVAKAEYFEGRGIKGWLQRTFFSGAGQVPIDRSGGRASEGALSTGLRILRSGECFGIYP